MADIQAIRQQVLDLVNQSDTFHFASVNEDGFPRPVPLIKVANEELNTFFFATSISSEKAHHIKENPKTGISLNVGCKVCSFTGFTEILTDEETKSKLWKDYFFTYFPTGLTDPNYCVFKFVSKRGYYRINGELIKDDLSE